MQPEFHLYVSRNKDANCAIRGHEDHFDFNSFYDIEWHKPYITMVPRDISWRVHNPNNMRRNFRVNLDNFPPERFTPGYYVAHSEKNQIYINLNKLVRKYKEDEPKTPKALERAKRLKDLEEGLLSGTENSPVGQVVNGAIGQVVNVDFSAKHDLDEDTLLDWDFGIEEINPYYIQSILSSLKRQAVQYGFTLDIQVNIKYEDSVKI